jgi:hypothetical protein
MNAIKRYLFCSLAIAGILACSTSGGGGDLPPSSDTVQDAAGTGPIDGAWRVDKKTCNGLDVDMSHAPETTLIIQGSSGRFENSYCTIPVTLTYPAAGSVEWVIGQNTCGGVGDKHVATYEVTPTTLTLTEELTPAGEWGCGNGRQVSTLTRVPGTG